MGNQKGKMQFFIHIHFKTNEQYFFATSINNFIYPNISIFTSNNYKSRINPLLDQSKLIAGKDLNRNGTFRESNIKYVRRNGKRKAYLPVEDQEENNVVNRLKVNP